MVRKVTPTLRLFIADLTRALAQNNGKVNIRRFIKTWRKVKGGQRLWDALNPVPAPKKGSQSRSA